MSVGIYIYIYILCIICGYVYIYYKSYLKKSSTSMVYSINVLFEHVWHFNGCYSLRDRMQNDQWNATQKQRIPQLSLNMHTILLAIMHYQIKIQCMVSVKGSHLENYSSSFVWVCMAFQVHTIHQWTTNAWCPSNGQAHLNKPTPSGLL